jgi:hypothetical protein
MSACFFQHPNNLPWTLQVNKVKFCVNMLDMLRVYSLLMKHICYIYYRRWLYFLRLEHHWQRCRNFLQQHCIVAKFAPTLFHFSQVNYNFKILWQSTYCTVTSKKCSGRLWLQTTSENLVFSRLPCLTKNAKFYENTTHTPRKKYSYSTARFLASIFFIKLILLGPWFMR